MPVDSSEYSPKRGLSLLVSRCFSLHIFYDISCIKLQCLDNDFFFFLGTWIYPKLETDGLSEAQLSQRATGYIQVFFSSENASLIFSTVTEK